jgi:YgiT-type zinc finger domain-containing protein
MTYPCPRCPFGHLQRTESTYVRRLGAHLVTQPNFPLWRCDSCGYTRYDRQALTRLEYLLGPDGESWQEEARGSQQSEGPAESGPRRWSS